MEVKAGGVGTLLDEDEDELDVTLLVGTNGICLVLFYSSPSRH